MHVGYAKMSGLAICLFMLIILMPGCKSKPEVAPVLNDLNLKAYSSRTITISQPNFATPGYPSPAVEAYIGATGAITAEGSSVSGASEGPVDVSKDGYQFMGLATGASYDIIVIAKNKAGFSIKNLTGVVPAVPNVDPASYLQIGNDEMGMFRWYLTMCDDPLDDFSKIESWDKDQYFISSYRYSIAFITYMLALEQYHKLNAWREYIKPRMDRLIQKMLMKQVWQYWAMRSKGVSFLEPLLNTPYPEERDPVGHKNIMYSAHLGQMIGLYEMLYRDLKWDEPGSIVFKWSETEQYVYDNNSLQKVMYDQMMYNQHQSIECEPNAVFSECNEHPILSFMLYDHVHGTNLAEARKRFLDFFLEKNFINPITHETAVLYLVKQKTMITQEFCSFGNGLSLVSVPMAWLGLINANASISNGWNGAFMHGWEPALIERHYPYQKKRHVVEPDSNTAHLKIEMITDQIATPLFAMLAGEVGDTATRDKLIAWCKDFYKPTWDDGMLHYPVGKDTYVNLLRMAWTPWPQAFTGVLVAFTAANPPSGIWKLHNKPFIQRDFESPQVTEVDFPNVLLTRAVYDFEKEALVMSTVGGALHSGSTSFNVTQLDNNRKWKLFLDGILQNEYIGVRSVSINVPLDAQHDIVLVAE
ncbi:MAG TPA: hypothetical protein VIS94_09000 [Desulfomonilia bacterium]